MKTHPSDDPLQVQARMLAEAKLAFLREVEILTGEVPGAISIQFEGVPLTPRFQLDDQRESLALAAEVASELHKRGLDGWQAALWWTGAHSALGGKRPLDLFESAPDRILLAARRIGDIPR